MSTYRIRFFSDRSGATTLENPLDPQPSGEYETVEAARVLALVTTKKMKMNAKSLVIEDNNGNVIERWDSTWGGFWRSL